MKLHWQFNPDTQQLRAPSGLVISVREIAQWVQDKVYNRHDLTGPWAGFRIRGRWMIGPRGVRVTPDTLQHLVKQQAQIPPGKDETIPWRNSPSSQER